MRRLLLDKVVPITAGSIMKPSIFVSHSCKDREHTALTELSPAARRDRADRLDFARRVRRQLYDQLIGSGRYDVWLDARGGLNPGDIWRDGIHQALRKCRGAVILLSPEAIESGWVLKEATILAWRAFLGEPILVVPVLLGITTQDLGSHGFDPSGIGALQAELVHRATARECDRVVAAIVERFDRTLPAETEVAASEWSTTVERWLNEMAKLLREDDESYIHHMFEVLGLEFDDHERFTDPYRTVAGELLDTETDDVLDVLNILSGVRTPDQKALLRHAVEALWVSASAAHRLPAIAAQPAPPRLVAIDAIEPVTGRDYIERAYCGKLRPDRIFAPDDHTDGTVDQIVARISELLSDYLPTEDPVRLADDVRRNGPVYLVLGQAASRADVLKELLRLYPPLTVVALTGDDINLTCLGEYAAAAELLAPTLGTREVDGRRYRRRLGAFA